jgi:protein-disulfide isomerase
MQMAHSLGINETPTLFLNGVQLHRVHELQQLEDAVDSALKNKTAAKLD